MDAQRILCFELARQVFAFPLPLVQEVVPLCPITKVFHTPGWVAGIINLRGRIVAVLDAAAMLGIGRSSRGKSTRLIVLGTQALDGAILVDSIRGIRLLDSNPAPMDSQIGEMGDFVTGILHTPEGPIALLDPGRILDANALLAYR